MISRLPSVLAVVLALAVSASEQSKSAGPAFEIADVHPSPRATFPFMHGGDLHGDRYELHQASMADMIASAYNLEAAMVQGGPSWLEMDRFDILAKTVPGTSHDDLRLMVRALLADRFKLVVHNGTAPLPAFVLHVNKDKPKMKESSGSGDPGCEYQPPTSNSTSNALQSVNFHCHGMTMDRLADELRQMARGYLDLPVVNSTALSGSWDFDLKWTPRGALGSAGADGISIFDAVDHELGLKLVRETAPRPALIVDSVNESPTPNLPNIEKSLPPAPPAKFDVAVIKPAKADANFTGSIRGLQMDVHGVPLRFLIDFAWDLNFNDREAVFNAPSWLDSAHFDILAKKSAEGDAPAAGQSSQIEQEELRQMLQNLLKERFKLKVHTEDHPVTAYTLMSVAPKLAKADPSSRTHCIEGPGPDGKDPRLATPVLNRLITCQNISMPQLAEQFRMIAAGYVYGSVANQTGLKGGYNFTLSFSSADRVQASGSPGTGSGTAPSADSSVTSSDPNGAVSLFDAVRRELGLKLEKERRSMPVLVIDHIDDHPTEN